MAFVTVQEVAVRLGWPLTSDEEARVQAFIEDCSVLIEDYCGKDFEPRANESFQLPAQSGCFLVIPRRFLPYLTITSVSFGDGVPLTDWEWRPTSFTLYRGAGWDQPITVTGSWGYNPLPAVLKTATTAEVIRWMAQTPGLAMERTGEREVEYATSSSPQSLSEAAKYALRRWKSPIGSISLRREDG